MNVTEAVRFVQVNVVFTPQKGSLHEGEGGLPPPRPKETVQNLATFLIQTGELGVLQASNARVLLDVLKCTGQPPQRSSGARVVMLRLRNPASR